MCAQSRESGVNCLKHHQIVLRYTRGSNTNSKLHSAKRNAGSSINRNINFHQAMCARSEYWKPLDAKMDDRTCMFFFSVYECVYVVICSTYRFISVGAIGEFFFMYFVTKMTANATNWSHLCRTTIIRKRRNSIHSGLIVH